MAPFFPTTIRTRLATTQWARTIWAASPLFLDLETTGLGPQSEIVEVGLLDQTGRTLYQSLIRPLRAIPPAATALHGITTAEVATAPTWAEVWPKVAPLLEDRVVAIYNAIFDVSMLAQNTRRIQGTLPAFQAVCVKLAYATWYGEARSTGQFRWHTLAAACARHGIPCGEHRSLADAAATRRLLGLLAEEG